MVYYYPNMAYHISTQNESKLKIAKQSYKGVKFIKSCSKLQKLPFKTKVAHKTKSCQKVAEQLVETPRSGGMPPPSQKILDFLKLR
jgi:hypothetical protein